MRLDLVGLDTLGGAVQLLAAKLGIGDVTYFHGWKPQAELREWMERADVLLVTSRHEAAPLVVGSRLYFVGPYPNPLFALDPIYQSIVDPKARERLVATYDHDVTQPEWSTGYRWDIVLRGPNATPFEAPGEAAR